jgi:hypothetical protein
MESNIYLFIPAGRHYNVKWNFSRRALDSQVETHISMPGQKNSFYGTVIPASVMNWLDLEDVNELQRKINDTHNAWMTSLFRI